MNIDQLRKAVRAQPFQPFTICLADGRKLFVPHPECVMIAPDATRAFGVAGPKEAYRIVNLLLVSSLDFSNGKRPGRRR